MKYIFDLHQQMREHSIILVYEGEFTQEITKSVLAMAERNMDSMGEESSIKRKVFNVMVECLQNIVKHSDDPDSAKKETNTAIFLLGKQEESYVIASGNPIANDIMPVVKDRLETINSLDKEGLKDLYKSIIKSGSGLTEKGGAGLGFVDIARKSGHKLEYTFEKLDDNNSFFCLRTTVSRF